MVWNKDLAKLKQDLKSEEVPGPKRPVPKPAAKPEVPRELEDEDALFLAVMGTRRKPTEPLQDKVVPQVAPPASKPTPAKAEFQEAMSSLKGIKPVHGTRPTMPEPSPEPCPPAMKASESLEPEPLPDLATSAEPPPPPMTSPEAPAPRAQPTIIQLAAGMAIDVDGSLDLRGHSATDAIERLKERLLDGHLLGWRTLHIHLGPSEELRQAFQAFLAGSEGELVTRYAQAPIPMGGAQAWILYLGIQGSTPH